MSDPILKEKQLFEFTPKSRQLPQESPIISEYKWGLIGLTASAVIITLKLLISNSDYLYKALVDYKLVSYETITSDGQVMLEYTWIKFVRFSKFWFPIVCGLATTYFTWFMVYLDSNVPGIQPPTPFSPKKYKLQSGHTFHLNYIFAVLVGIMVSTYMFYKGVELSY